MPLQINLLMNAWYNPFRCQKQTLRQTCHCYYLIIITIFLLGFTTTTSATATSHSEPISLRFQDAPVRVVLQALADHQQLNLVVADSVSGNLTLRLDNVEWQKALDVVLHLTQLDIELKNNVMIVMPLQEQRLRRQQQLDELAQSKQQQPLSRITVALQHRDAEELVSLLAQQKGLILSERAQITAEQRANILLIHDYPENLSVIKTFISELDSPQQQVQITAHIVTMSNEGLEELGIKWGLAETDALGINMFNINLGINSPSLQAGFNIAKLSGRLLSLELSALEQESQVDIIASPRLLTANNQSASIKQGTELPYEVSSGANGATSIEFKSAVLGLDVTPRILPNNKINLILSITQNTPGRTIKQSNGGEVLAIDTQEIKTQVIVSHNETLVLGGVFQHSNIVSIEKVPLLADIPLLGKLFSRESHKQTKRELIIFITPTLIDI